MTPSIETRTSWITASMSLVILGVSFGAMWIAVVALKPIAAELGGVRSVPSLATALAWFGAGLGGIGMGWFADRYGVRWTVLIGSVSIAIGLAISSLGQTWELYLGHGLFMGLLGNAGLNAPLYVYVSRWFDRRRGSALALIASGQYISGAIWPPIFDYAIGDYGWRETMLMFARVRGRRHRADRDYLPHGARPRSSPPPAASAQARGRRVLGWPPNVVFAMLVDRGVLLLHADVDAAVPSGRAVQRSRHQAGAWRRDAVAAARHGIRQPADLGLDLRPHRRAGHGFDRIGLAVLSIVGIDR